MMEPSFEKLLELLAEAGVAFIVVGGIAVSIQGYVRLTEDVSWSSLGSFTTTYTDNDVNLVWSAVPEPNAAILVGGFGMIALCRRRRG
jgi:hypothetical protein